MRIATIALAAAVMASVPAVAQAQFRLEVVAEGLDAPLFVTAPAGDPRLFIVEQPGRILLLEDGAVNPEPFLDIRGDVDAGGERGLLGLAFHPDYASNGHFYVNYTDRQGHTRVVGYTVSPGNPNVADPASADEVLFVEQPAANHNGGWIDFGPDGLLYVAMGDGGGGGDPQGNAQDPDALLGKILRLDVGAGGSPQVFASGVRNPWRNAFDGDRLIIADVGQRAWEEINVVPLANAGANLGWNIMEGFECYEAETCDQSGLTLPIHAYATSEGCSVTGGYVYRGAAIPAIEGRYFFADYCSGIVSSFVASNEGVSDPMSHADILGRVGPITSFGLDSAGEMYLVTQDGLVRKFVP